MTKSSLIVYRQDVQQSVYDDIQGSAIINAWVSWGKTFTALAIANKLKQKTLIVTHTVALRSQWEKECKKVFGVAAGVIGSGRFEINEDIVIGNLQTLYRNQDKIAKEFGTIILDEMHHVSSPTFTRIIDSNRARHKIGLTGTMQRKDGRHVVFRDYFSNTVYKPPKENYLTQSIFSEGISVDCLSCLILGTPINNEPLLTQLIGRVIRLYEGKPQPVIVDIHLEGRTARKQAGARMGYYMKQGYEVAYL